MATLSNLAKRIRSKNAGPFWVTVDVFFEDSADFQQACKALDSSIVADALQVENEDLKRFDLADISVIKFSFPRSIVQGSRFDRDMHGAQYANLLYEIEL